MERGDVVKGMKICTKILMAYEILNIYEIKEILKTMGNLAETMTDQGEVMIAAMDLMEVSEKME